MEQPNHAFIANKAFFQLQILQILKETSNQP